MISSFAFVVIKGPSLIKIISARNQDIFFFYEALIKVDIYGVGLATTRFPTLISGAKINNITPFGPITCNKSLSSENYFQNYKTNQILQVTPEKIP